MILNLEEGARLINEIKHWLVLLSFIYVILIFQGERFMKNRASFNLRMPLIIWSTSLALFSIIGARVLLEELVECIRQKGWQYSICNNVPHMDGMEIWVFLFWFSKVVEFGDTVFIVLRKKKLHFLHWYHHITVLLYTTYSCAERAASPRWFATVNITVHAAMYSYYAGSAMKFRFPKAVSMTLTALQISQMIVGLGVQLSVFTIKFRGGECHQSYANFALGMVMYLSYFCLFIHFFNGAYIKPKTVYNGARSLNDVKTEKVK